MNPDRMLIVKTGAAFSGARHRFGDFEDWFARAIGVDLFDYVTVDVSREARLPSMDALDDYAGVVVTGSPAMVSHRLDWSEFAARWLARVVDEDRRPVLGVCYGHQLIAHALGGRVGPNPSGRQMGTQAFAVDDPGDELIGPLAPSADVQVTHLEAVIEPPPRARILGGTEADPHHALRFGRRSWGVQFHPEFDAAIMRCYVEARSELLDGEGFDSGAILEAVSETAVGSDVLRRFAAICKGEGNGEIS